MAIEKNNPLVVMGVILGLSLMLSAGIGAYSFYKVRSLDNSLSVTGSARKQVTSDTVKWTTELSHSTENLQEGNTLMQKDKAAVIAFLKESGFAEKDIEVSPTFMDHYTDYNRGQTDGKNFTQYNFRQTFEIESSDIGKVTKVAKNIDPLTQKGVQLSTQSLDYFYSKLPELRVELLGEAIKDARVRAAKIAESDNQEVGSLQSASVGVVQVLAPNSTDISDYGTYDTSKIEKEVMVTVKAAFTLE